MRALLFVYHKVKRIVVSICTKYNITNCGSPRADKTSVVESSAEDVNTRVAGLIHSTCSRSCHVESILLVEGLCGCKDVNKSRKQTTTISHLGQQRSDGVEFDTLEEVELGVGGLAVHQSVHGGPQLGLSPVPQVLQQLLDHVSLVYVLLGSLKHDVGHHKDILSW